MPGVVAPAFALVLTGAACLADVALRVGVPAG
jgi:hypothetical protein